jgi:hypothetical protein
MTHAGWSGQHDCEIPEGARMNGVRAAIRHRVKRVPAWFRVVAILPGPPGADPAWGITLKSGRYALVCEIDRSSALHALAEVRIRQLAGPPFPANHAR